MKNYRTLTNATMGYCQRLLFAGPVTSSRKYRKALKLLKSQQRRWQQEIAAYWNSK